jgi:site-specific recombinase XerC
MAKSWIDRFIEWGLTRAENPWEPGTAKAYRRELERLERLTGKPVEELTAEDLSAYQARHRSEPASTWNSRYHAAAGFFQYLAAQGFFQELDARGRRRIDPSSAISTRREEPKPPPPSVDVLKAIAEMPEGRDKQIALFLYHSVLKIGEAESIREPPVDGKVHVRHWGGKWEWVSISDKALELLDQLGGRVSEPGKQRRAIQRNLPVTPTQIENAAKRDRQLRRTSQGDALGPVWALLVGRPELLKVARAYRDAVEEMEDPNGRPNAAITAAARALQEMLIAMGAKGNRLGPLFVSARSQGRFGSPYDNKLADAIEALVDWTSATRVGLGDAHVTKEPTREDAWLALRIVAALLLRLEATMP